jgi:hypothetical protein
MKFQYKKLGRNSLGQDIIRPIIPIKLKNGEREIRYEVLVDSGADICIMDAEIAELIGIKVTEGKKASFAGATGKSENCYSHIVEIEVGGWSYKTEVAFAEGLSKAGYGIVGQRGFFEFFKVTFNYSANELEIKPKT